MAIPIPRYRSRLGSPLREEIRTAATATSSTSEQMNRSSLSWWTVSGPTLSSYARRIVPAAVLRYLT
jgi:hypothetical protein